MHVIEFQGLAKWYGSQEAVKPLSLIVPRGTVFSFLGPQGAGKTTTLRMMMGILVPSAGRVLVDGHDCQADAAKVKRRVGYLPDVPVFYDFLRGHEILRFAAEMHGLSRHEAQVRSDRLLAELGLEAAAGDFAVDHSLGMKKKLALACALIHEPAVLILDEPTDGLDARAALAVQERLLAEAARGTTVLVSTRSRDMAERISDQVGILHRGSLMATGSPDQVRAAMGMTDDVAEAVCTA
jgi:ABC-2 type transport system ATP-binding protein